MEKKLVYDIGMHTGQDTITYLKKGYKVIAVEASPLLAEEGREKFSQYIKDGSLTILNVGISDKEGILPFYINLKTSEWSSFDFTAGTRNNSPYEVKNIQCITTADMLRQYGVPYLLKVDIEGLDYLCINDLPEVAVGKGVEFVSCEASDVSLIDTMYAKGYRKFKLIHQAYNFNPININLEKNKMFPYLLQVYIPLKIRFQKVFPLEYPYSSSGPMPHESKGPWLDYTTVRQQYVDFYQGDLKKPLGHKSWFDFHATL